MIRSNTKSSVDLPVKFRRRAARSSIATRVVRAVDVAITRVQEWLEAPDRRCDLVVAYLVIGAMVVFLVAALARMGG